MGFFGRDETLLALDRGFDRHHALLLYAYAGSGKTTTAAEFARWYSLTGGVQGPVLFTSFEQRKTLVQVLDQLGRMFDPLLQKNGIQWDAIPDAAPAPITTRPVLLWYTAPQNRRKPTPAPASKGSEPRVTICIGVVPSIIPHRRAPHG